MNTLPIHNNNDPVLRFKLMLKQHYETGINYLCITKRNNWQRYKGSGIRWNRLIKKHPSEIYTTLIYSSNNIEEFNSICVAYSNLLNVKGSSIFANLIDEMGYDKQNWGIIGQEALKKKNNRGGCCTTKWALENKENHLINCSNAGKLGGKIVGSMFWWNNGVVNKKAFKSPGQEWQRGLIMSVKKRNQVYTKLAGHNKGKI
jgi:hypothetical protein